jgi:hypothetical protein
MAYRILTDSSGSTWQVWAVLPAPLPRARQAAVASEYRQGWLAFERVDSGAGPGAAHADPTGPSPEKRRLAPIPPEWEDATEAALVDLLVAAKPVTSASPRPRRASPPYPAEPPK